MLFLISTFTRDGFHSLNQLYGRTLIFMDGARKCHMGLSLRASLGDLGVFDVLQNEPFGACIEFLFIYICKQVIMFLTEVISDILIV